MSKSSLRREARLRRKVRVRKKVVGTDLRPRLNVFRSAVHIYAQLIDDSNGVTLASCSTLCSDVKGEVNNLKKIEAAKVVGKKIAELAKAKGIEQVVFDRNGFLYHGRVQALSDGAREAGLKF